MTPTLKLKPLGLALALGGGPLLTAAADHLQDAEQCPSEESAVLPEPLSGALEKA